VVEPLAARNELIDLVARLADNKYFLGRRYAEWCTAAPTLESAVAAAAMAQDEIGHARSLYPLLQDLAGESPETEAETRTAFTNAGFLDEPFGSWCDFVAANFLFDTAITVVLEAAQNSSQHELAQRAKRMVEEEPLHWLHGEGWTRRLPPTAPAVRDQLAASLSRVAPFALAWFDIARPSLVEDGTVEVGADTLCARFRSRVNPVLSGSGLPPV
jgi:phenylacetate-CoA oxygenase PaaI subunit